MSTLHYAFRRIFVLTVLATTVLGPSAGLCGDYGDSYAPARRYGPAHEHPNYAPQRGHAGGYDYRGAYASWSSVYVGAGGYASVAPYEHAAYNAYYYRPGYLSPGPHYFYYHRPRSPAYYSGYNYYASPYAIPYGAPAQMYVPAPSPQGYVW